jgi:hypothetical protein
MKGDNEFFILFPLFSPLSQKCYQVIHYTLLPEGFHSGDNVFQEDYVFKKNLSHTRL